MNDDKVIDLNAERLRRSHKAEHDAHEEGEAWAFEPWDYAEDTVGFIDEPGYPVSFLFDFDQGIGICMSRESAEKLLADLTGALKSPYAPWNDPTFAEPTEE